MVLSKKNKRTKISIERAKKTLKVCYNHKEKTKQNKKKQQQQQKNNNQKNTAKNN